MVKATGRTAGSTQPHLQSFLRVKADVAQSRPRTSGADVLLPAVLNRLSTGAISHVTLPAEIDQECVALLLRSVSEVVKTRKQYYGFASSAIS
jgi:hypothetical protein